MSLKKYHAKRTFDTTPEPHGAKKQVKTKKLAFVVQKHHASQLHYDFRLELGGVLKSWAVPKGPSLNPHDRHLAVMVEDHPFEYRKFEGEIPEGNYGAGSVIIWDQGTYYPRQETSDPEKTLRKELKAGHLTFIMEGEKLKGEFALIKLHDAEEDAWLLIKKGDEFASKKDITKQDKSVVSGKGVDENKVDLNTLPKSKPPQHVKPMLATLIDKPFSREGWIFEMKWDGYRAIGAKYKDEVELYSRNGLDFRERYSPIAEALRAMTTEVVLDGEIVAVDDKGHPHFEWLQNWENNKQGELCYFVFDVLWGEGHDLRNLPLVERKSLLQKITPKQGPIIFSDHVEEAGEKLFREVQKQKLEGIMAKKADSQYVSVRSGNWLKIKTHLRQEVVIGGFTEGRRSRTYMGALILGVYEGDNFIYVGHTNAGMPDEQRHELRVKLDMLERQTPPFAIAPKPNAPVHWVTPKIVCEVEFEEWTKEGVMRQPEFKGLRPDKPARTVHHEHAKSGTQPKTKSNEVEFTHLDKTFWPEKGYTKGDLIEYYRQVSSYILPYLKDRPLSLLRQPNGYKDRGFFQKDITFHVPPFAKTVKVYSESNKEDIHFLVANNEQSLLYLVQLGSIEINPWNSRTDHFEKPDWGVLDLDPEGVDFKTVVKVAQTIREVTEEWKLACFPKTSGKTGIHIFFPMGAQYTYEQVRNFIHLLAIEVNKRLPKITSLERSPAERQHRVYLDYLQNSRGQTLAAPYAARPTKDATVSTPLHWKEVTAKLDPTQFTIKTIIKRLEKEGDLWKPVLKKSIDLKKVIKQLEANVTKG